MMDTVMFCRGTGATAGNVEADRFVLRPGVTPSDAAKFGRTSTGGIEGAFVEATVRKVLVEPPLIVRFSGRLRNAVGVCAAFDQCSTLRKQ